MLPKNENDRSVKASKGEKPSFRKPSWAMFVNISTCIIVSRRRSVIEAVGFTGRKIWPRICRPLFVGVYSSEMLVSFFISTSANH